MGNCTFLNLVNEIRYAMNANLYNCALTLALTLPDICGKAEYPCEKSSRKRYKKWFSFYAAPSFCCKAENAYTGDIVNFSWLSAEECWALRCSVLHSGNYRIERTKLKHIILHSHKDNRKNQSHFVRDSKFADLDVILLCNILCDSAEKYYTTCRHPHFIIDNIAIIHFD